MSKPSKKDRRIAELEAEVDRLAAENDRIVTGIRTLLPPAPLTFIGGAGGGAWTVPKSGSGGAGFGGSGGQGPWTTYNLTIVPPDEDGTAGVAVPA